MIEMGMISRRGNCGAGEDCGAKTGRGEQCGSGACGVFFGWDCGGGAGEVRADCGVAERRVAVLNGDDVSCAGFWAWDGRAGCALMGRVRGVAVRAVHIAEMGVEGVVFTVETQGERASVQLQMLGRHNVLNALAAIAVGLRSGMSLGDCAAAVGEIRAGDKRGEIIAWREATLINDSYNSNPRALDAMVDALMAMPAERHIVVAGEMLELGEAAAELHAECGRRMVERGVSLVVGVRGVAKSLVDAALAGGVEAVFVDGAEAAGAWLKENVRAGDAGVVEGIAWCAARACFESFRGVGGVGCSGWKNQRITG